MGSLMGGGGGVDIPQRQAGPEWQTVKKLYGGQENQLNKYIRKDPLLSTAYSSALEQQGQVPGLQKPLQELIGSQTGFYRGLEPTIETQGALTPEQERDVTQATRAGFAARGNVTGNQALGGELLNRDVYRRERYKEALGNALGLSGSIANLTGQAQQVGTQGLQNLLGTSRAGVQNFSQLTNPILGYLQDLFSSNQNAAASQSIAGANKQSGATSGALSTIGSVIGGVAVAY